MDEKILPAAGLVPAARGWTYATVGALGGGLLFGILTNLTQGWLPGSWNQIANSSGVWSVVAFAVASLLAERVALSAVAMAGVCAEVGLVVGYYGYAEFGRGSMGDSLFPLIWLAMAFIVGPLFGIAGSWWRQGRTTQRRVIGLAVPAGAFGMEGIHYARTLHYAPQAWACVTVAVLVSLMACSHKERALTLATAVPFSFLAYTAIELRLSQVSQ